MGAPIRFSRSVSLDGECPHCGFLSWCSPADLNLSETQRLSDLVTHQRQIKRGGFLHRAGEALGSLYVVRSGFLKTILRRDNGHEQVTGFSMTGDLIGMDAIGTGKHLCDTIALEDSTLCGMRYADFEDLGRTVPALQHHFHRFMSAEIARDKELMFLLGSMHASERTAGFLLGMSKRFAARGYSGTRFRLPMTRQEIASHIGLKLETVSRAFSDFQDREIIARKRNDVEIRSLARLQQVLETPI
jgi:CRP/FNR family transcriptional regulator, anaerobic regulatory protein